MSRRMSKVVTVAATRSISGKFNHDIAYGLATTELTQMANLLDEILKSTFSDPSMHLVYDGYSRVYPEEAAQEIRKVSKGRGHDITASDLHMLKFRFRYGENLDKVIEKYRWSAYARPGNVTFLGGTKHVVRPVLTDKVISPGTVNTFLRLLRDKISIDKITYSCQVGDVRLPDMSVPTMRLYRTKPKDKVTACKSTLIHYILGQYGLSGTLRFLGLPSVTVLGLEGKYDPNLTDVYSSAVINGSDIRLAVAKEDRSIKLDHFMCSLFYILDTTKADQGVLESVGEWRRLLGSILYGNKTSIWLTTNMQRHYETLLTAYMPPIMVKFIDLDFGDSLGEDFSEEGFFKLLKITFQNFDMWMSIANEISAVAYDKRYSINYFVLYDTITRINKIAWVLTEAKLSDRLNDKVVMDCLSKHFTLRGIYKMSHKDNISVQSVSHHVDSYVHGLSTNVAIQLNTGGATAARKSGAKSPVDSTTMLHESHIAAGTQAGISSARLSPLSMMNIFAPLDSATMTIIPPLEDLMHLESLREVLSRTPRRSKTGTLPTEFNRFVESPVDVPDDW